MEQQNIEYKSSWHDDYLKWICGFANAQGGRVYIGKDDNGKVVGIEDYKRLMDDVPNKIKNNMGITAEVNLLQENGKHFIKITVQPYSVPISLRGRYYYRSGSVKQELTGAALNEFLLKRIGHTWDDVIDERASFNDIDEPTIKKYLRKAEEAGGSGIGNIVTACKTAGLPEPEISEQFGGFIVKLFKDRFTEEKLQKIGLNVRQIRAVLYVKEKRKITNKEYQEINEISNRTATYELKELIEKFNILKISGASVGTYYEFS
jgi:predicted HTH transcriptional regulator